MSRHEGVSCDSCLKGNFRGRRYKCLICYDYDLCSTCYEAGVTTTRHTTEHPMQCILTRNNFDLFYGGETLIDEQPQAFTCPYCGKMGFTKQALHEHVTADHSELSFEVVCPVCASLPVGDPNLVTDDFAGHLSLEHHYPARDEPANRRGVRRIPPPTSRGMNSTRTRRSNTHFSSSGGLTTISPSSRDNIDPITELLSQLSGVRRTQGSTPSQTLYQLERQQVRAARQQLERLPDTDLRSAPTVPSPSQNKGAPVESPPLQTSRLMLAGCLERSTSEVEMENAEKERADRSLFVQELMMATLRDETQKFEKKKTNSWESKSPLLVMGRV